MYDWSVTYGKDGALVDPAAVDAWRVPACQTLYIQTSKWDSPTDMLEPERLLPIIERAHADRIRVVAWYLPTFEDPQRDMARIMAARRLPSRPLAVDIESLRFKDVPERNRRLIEISTNLRAALPNVALAAIPFPPVAMDVINPHLGPFPVDAAGALVRPLDADELPERAHARLRLPRRVPLHGREHRPRARPPQQPDVPIHAIGGVADRTSRTTSPASTARRPSATSSAARSTTGADLAAPVGGPAAFRVGQTSASSARGPLSCTGPPGGGAGRPASRSARLEQQRVGRSPHRAIARRGPTRARSVADEGVGRLGAPPVELGPPRPSPAASTRGA